MWTLRVVIAAVAVGVHVHGLETGELAPWSAVAPQRTDFATMIQLRSNQKSHEEGQLVAARETVLPIPIVAGLHFAVKWMLDHKEKVVKIMWKHEAMNALKKKIKDKIKNGKPDEQMLTRIYEVKLMIERYENWPENLKDLKADAAKQANNVKNNVFASYDEDPLDLIEQLAKKLQKAASEQQLQDATETIHPLATLLAVTCGNEDKEGKTAFQLITRLTRNVKEKGVKKIPDYLTEEKIEAFAQLDALCFSHESIITELKTKYKLAHCKKIMDEDPLAAFNKVIIPWKEALQEKLEHDTLYTMMRKMTTDPELQGIQNTVQETDSCLESLPQAAADNYCDAAKECEKKLSWVAIKARSLLA